MLPHGVEISGDKRHLCKERGFLAIYNQGERLGRLPLDDLGVVLVSGHGITYSNDLLVELADRCVPLLLCNKKMLPVGLFWSLEGHHIQSKRIQAQATVGRPLCKRLWQQIIKSKIIMQGYLVGIQGGDPGHFFGMAERVKSGDPDNLEATAARLYWAKVFGQDFRRRRHEPGINALLNYAYTILRSATARAVMLAGLHPAFAVFHHNARNSMPLVDDLMEPYRPAADLAVVSLIKKGKTDLDTACKRALIGITTQEVVQGKETRIVAESLRTAASSLADAYLGKRRTINLPHSLKQTDKNINV